MPKLITEMTPAEADELIAKQVLDPEEQEIEDALVAGHYRSQGDLKLRFAELQKAAANTRLRKPVTMRLPNLLIGQLKMKAQDEGIAYQTLINSVLHKYVSGRLVERD